MRMLVTIATFNKREPAEAASARLEQSGIPTEIVDEAKLQKYWFLAHEPLANVRLKVDNENYPRAEQLSREWDAKDGLMREAIRCPECGSSRIEYPQFTRKFITPTILAVLCWLHIFDPEYYCEDCQYTWPPGRVKSPSEKW